jgi:hypothetical protein
MSMYTKNIRETAARIGRLGYNARHVEAWMRLERGTLDALSRDAFAREVEEACRCIDATTTDESERLAASYGLKE